MPVDLIVPAGILAGGRLVQATPVTQMAERLDTLRRDSVAGDVTQEAFEGLAALFRAPRSPGVVMAVKAVQLDVPAVQVETQLTMYVRELQRLLSI